MADKLENIFNECLDRISQGESIESCLSSYPKEAAQLEPLLRTAMGFSWRVSAIRPRPEFKVQTRAQLRFQAVQLDTIQAKQPQHTGFFTWQRAWAVALTTVLICVLTGAGTVAASADALPDQPLYQVKLAAEQVKVAFAVSDEKKAEVYSQLAETRAMEIAAMAQQGKTELVVATTDRLANNLEKADSAIARLEEATAQAAASATTQPTAPTTPMPTPTQAPTQPTPMPTSTPTPTPTTAAGETAAPPTTQTTPSAVNAPPSKVKTAEARKVEQLNQEIAKNNEKSLAALEKALDQAPSQAKPALQRAIQTISEKGSRKPANQPSTEGQNQVPSPTTSNQTQPQNLPPIQDQTHKPGLTQSHR